VGNRNGAGGRALAAELFLPLLLFGFLSLAAAWPLSVHPVRLFPAHRTAAKHATTMYHFADYFRGGSRPVAYLDLWGYPAGGIAKPQGIPSLATGWFLSRLFPPRTVFNVLVLFNLVLSGLSLYLLGRQIGLGSIPAAALGTLAGFHPVLQSFLLRGQIENTTLWPAGFTLLALAAIVRGPERRWPAIAAVCLLPAVTLLTTAYYAFFLLLASPLLLALLLTRWRPGWRAPTVRTAVAALAAGAALTLAAAQFYRPDTAPGALPNLHPNTLQLGLAGVVPAAGFGDLINPANFIADEKPYLGLSLLACVLAAATLLLLRRRRQGELAVLGGGTLLFALLALGRNVGDLALPAALADQFMPDFRLFTMLVRGLPFMAVFAGLIVALALEELPSRWARAGLGILVLLTLADHAAVNSPSACLLQTATFDERTEIDVTVRSLPKFGTADLPLADLPPPIGRNKFLWNRYTYFQTEHLQRIVWSDTIPDPPSGLAALLAALCDHPRDYAGDADRLRDWSAAVRGSGLRLILLHKDYVSQESAVLLSFALDSVFLRIGESSRVTAWAVSGEPSAPQASTEGAGMETGEKSSCASAL